MDFNAFKEWVFLGLLAGGVHILYSLKQSVEELNVKMAVIIEKTGNHEKRIENLESKSS
jgi:hypothetical protein